jgi:transposase
VEIPLKTKIAILDEVAKNNNKQKASEMFGVSRRTVITYCKKEDEIRAEFEAAQLSPSKSIEIPDELMQMGIVDLYTKKYLSKLNNIDDLEARKKAYVATLEKVMWDHLSKLDDDVCSDIKPEVRVKMLKDLNEIREKLSGEPSVVIEYRNKWKIETMTVLKDFLDADEMKEFGKRMQKVEEAEYEEI